MSYDPTSNPTKTSGQWHSIKGNVKEAVGNVLTVGSLQRHGKEEHVAGETEYNTARAKGYAEGTGDRVKGKKDQVVGAVTNDKSQQASGNAQRGKGEAQQDVNRKI